MRSKIVFVLLLAMGGTLGFLLYRRARAPHAVVAQPTVIASSNARDGGAAAPSAAASPDAGGATASVAARDASTAAAARDAGPPPARMDRPLRVTALGWELLAPGVIANRGAVPGTGSVFTADGLTVHLSATDSASEVERSLARGGTDPHGADVAIVPLPVFVAGYERLRALAPEVFFVVGWSRGREGVASAHATALTTPPSASEVRVRGDAGTTAAFVALFALELSGVPASRMVLVESGGRGATMAPVSAVDRSGPAEPGEDARRLVLTTADAARLVPFVAVAPHGFVQSHAEALKAWARGWLAGMDTLHADVPTAARTVSEVGGAPDALALLQRLGLIEGTTLRDNARVMGLAGRGAVTLERLFQRTWRLWRAVGVLSTPAPESAPLATATVAALVRADPSLARAPTSPATTNGGGAPPLGAGTPPAGATAMLVRRAAEGARFDEAAFVDDLGFIAGVFERAPVRVSVRSDPNRARALLTNARDRFDLAPARLFAGRAVPGGGSAPAAIEVLSTP